MLQELEQLGISKNEAKIYLALLKHESATSGVIIKDTSIHVSAVYYAIDNLIKKGLVTYITRANRKYFQATEPKQLLQIIEEQNKVANKVVPELEQLQRQRVEPVTTVVHEGYKGLKGIYDRLLSTLTKGEEYCVIGARQIADPTNKPLYLLLTNFHKHREEKGVKVRILFQDDVRASIVQKVKHYKNMQARFVPKSVSFLLIYHDRVITFLPSGRMLAVEIVSQEVADSYREYFELIWKGAQ